MPARPPNVTVYFESQDQYKEFLRQAKDGGFKSKSAYGFKVLAEACKLPLFFDQSESDETQRVSKESIPQEATA